MKHILSILLLGLFFVPPSQILAENAQVSIQQLENVAQSKTNHTELKPSELLATNDHDEHSADDHATHGEETHEEGAHAVHEMPAMWSVIPFIALLLMIATGPLFYAHFWHKYYPHVAFVLGAIVVAYYQFVLHSSGHIVHSFFEYFAFISLLTGLFVASGGILINIDKKGTPMTNVLLLILGAAIANVVGTTGASMLLIRPFMRLNKGRIKAYHVIFFIFMVSNVGGSLTPIGDPPLFLGFLKGVPFMWTVTHVWPYWFFGIGLLAGIFFVIDSRNKELVEGEYTGKVKITGAKNVIFLAIIIAAVFVDPNVIDMPSWMYISFDDGTHVAKLSYIREVVMLLTALAAFKLSNKEALKGNDFNFEPILEVAFLFVGIFFTMMPALQLIGSFAQTQAGQDVITSDSLYWLTGSLSGVLDNAPTYMNFFTAALGKSEMLGQVDQFVATTSDPKSINYGYLLAISISSVFFGAMTYIGNAPNFMVKAIAEQNGLEMPAFVTYIVKYSLPILLPVLFLTWLFIKFMS